MIDWTDTPLDAKTLCSRPSAFPILARFPAAEEEPKSNAATTGKDTDGREGSDTNPPVSYLLYSVRKCTKVSGTSLRWDDREMTFSNNGINYVIPITYPGWFRILSRDTEPPSLIAPLTSIEQVVASKSTSFLVHSCITGLWPNQLLSRTTSKRDSFQEVQVFPGEVIICGPVFVEPQEDCLLQLSCCFCPPFRDKKETLQTEKMYLQGRGTTSGIDILLPLETCGQFSCIGSTLSNSGEDLATTSQLPVIYQMKDLVNRNDFPQMVQLVFGTPPSSEPQSDQSFTGLVELGHVYSEESIIACQIASGDQLAFLEFPEDSDVEFLLANNWEMAREDASVRKAIDFCQQFSDSYKLEIQPIIESMQLQKIAAQQQKDSTGVCRSGTFRKETVERISPEFFDSLPETATNPTSLQRAVRATPRLQSGTTVPTISQRITVNPTNLQRPQVVPRTLQHEVAILNASRPRVAYKSSEWHQDANSLHNTSRTDVIPHDKDIKGNAAQRAKVAAVSLPNSPENGKEGSVVKKVPIWFTKSLDGQQLNKTAIALVHTPRPYRDPSAIKPQHDHMQNITPYNSQRMTDRKLPPLPSHTDATEESNQIQSPRISSEVESNASDPDRLYERIPCQKGISNEPSPSAPSSPAPTIRNRQDITITVSPSAYDQDGYLTPVELRDSGPVLERGKERIGFPGTFANTGNCKKKLGQNYYSSHQRYLNSQMNPIPLDHRCDPERLQSFLDDSVAELYRKQLHRRYSERTTDTGRERFYRRNNSSERKMTHRTTLRSLSTPGSSSQDFLHRQEDADAYLDTIFDCEDADEEQDYSLRFLRRYESTSLRIRRYNSAATAPYHGFDSFSDSGIASRQSTMQKKNRQLASRKKTEVSWVPPEDLSSLSVEEVAMSLRYIGMKDQIVASFSKEQVDGKLLCEMNNHLLKEGFPNMNSLERKKVLDFVQGWRPKRLLFV